MAVDLEIKCVKKHKRFDPSSRITHVGGVHESKRWLFAEEQVIESIEQGKLSFFVTSGGAKHRIVIAERKGVKFIRSEADKLNPDMLTALPECP